MKNNNTFTYALPNSKETRAGAMACIRAIRKVTKLVDFKNLKTDSYLEVLRNGDDAGQIMLDATGANLSQFETGFILLFAEYIEDVVTRGEPPDLSIVNTWDGWNPYSTKTTKQIEALRKERLDDHDEIMAEENNVISLCAFRNK